MGHAIKRKVILSVILTLTFCCTHSYAQIGIDLGTEYGFGLAYQLGTYRAKIEAGAGVAPIFAYWHIESSTSREKDYFKLYFPLTVGAKVNLAISSSDRQDRLALKFGISYNTIIQTGIGGGFEYSIAQKPTYAVISAGIMVYRDAFNELLKKLNEEEDTSFVKDDLNAPLVNIQPFISACIFIGK